MRSQNIRKNSNSDYQRRYEKDGIFFPVNIFSPVEIDDYRRDFDNVDATQGFDRSNQSSSGRHFDLEFVWRIATCPRLLDLMKDLIGSDILLLDTDFFVKHGNPSGDKFVAWHQDVTYWGLEPAEAHTAWIAIDDCDIGNGCMRVITGSHHDGIARHGTSARSGNLLSINQEIPDEIVDSKNAVDVELLAGQVSIHNGLLFHASMPNRSKRRRAGLTVRYISTKVHQRKKNSYGKEWHPVLVAGEDSYQHFSLKKAPFPVL